MSESSSLNKEKILNQLTQVKISDSNDNVVSAGLISGVTIHGGNVGFLIAGDANNEALRKQCERAALNVDGVEQVTAVLTNHNSGTQPARQKAVWNREPIPGIKQIIAVASGKGGVGKSSISVLLALALAEQGKRIGLLDADIYGPSVPTMLGVGEQAEIEDGKLIPQTAFDIKAMSMGMIIGDQAAVMRAPRVTKALNQMLHGTDWAQTDAPLDTLIVDMPPGTGDVHLSMVQNAPIDGAVIVTLASKVAALDAKKSIEMFEKVDVPILGIIENMSSMEGGATPFGSGGGETLAKETGYPLLAKLPLEPEVGGLLNEGANPLENIENSDLLGDIRNLAKSLFASS